MRVCICLSVYTGLSAHMCLSVHTGLSVHTCLSVCTGLTVHVCLWKCCFKSTCWSGVDLVAEAPGHVCAYRYIGLYIGLSVDIVLLVHKRPVGRHICLSVYIGLSSFTGLSVHKVLEVYIGLSVCCLKSACWSGA